MGLFCKFFIFKFHSLFKRIGFAGTPTTTVFSFTSFTTTAPAPTTQSECKHTFPITIAPALTSTRSSNTGYSIPLNPIVTC